MSIKTQKIIRFIPIINFITVFLWIGCVMHNSVRIRDFFKDFLTVFVGMLAVTLIRFAFIQIFENEILNTVTTFLHIYLCFFIFSCVTVRAQERILASKDSEQ